MDKIKIQLMSGRYKSVPGIKFTHCVAGQDFTFALHMSFRNSALVALTALPSSKLLRLLPDTTLAVDQKAVAEAHAIIEGMIERYGDQRLRSILAGQ